MEEAPLLCAYQQRLEKGAFAEPQLRRSWSPEQLSWAHGHHVLSVWEEVLAMQAWPRVNSIAGGR